MVSTTFTTDSTNIIFLPISPDLLAGAKQGKASLDIARKPTAPSIDSFKERLHAEGISKESTTLIAGARRRGKSFLYKLA